MYCYRRKKWRKSWYPNKPMDKENIFWPFCLCKKSILRSFLFAFSIFFLSSNTHAHMPIIHNSLHEHTIGQHSSCSKNTHISHYSISRLWALGTVVTTPKQYYLFFHRQNMYCTCISKQLQTLTEHSYLVLYNKFQTTVKDTTSPLVIIFSYTWLCFHLTRQQVNLIF
jgi:hypothetical protein